MTRPQSSLTEGCRYVTDNEPTTEVTHLRPEIKLLANEVRAEGTEVRSEVVTTGGSRCTVILRANENVPLV
jgi:hypothetical protein